MYIDFMFEDYFTGEQFFVELEEGATLEDAYTRLKEYDIYPEQVEFIEMMSQEDADILGYDTY